MNEIWEKERQWRERIQKRKKDKITWQVIIHSTFFFFNYSFLFHFLDDYFQLIQIEISFWYSSCSPFDFIFWRCILNAKKKERNSRSRKKWWNFLICRTDETQWNDWRRKTNSKEKERNEIWETTKENKSQREKYNLTSY